MKKLVLVGVIVALGMYFALMSAVMPQAYLEKSIIQPQPVQSVIISDSEIVLGDSFDVEIITENQNDYSDILITSVAFPTLQVIGTEVDLAGYDYTNSPRYVEVGDSVASKYTEGPPVQAVYPSIEAMSRNVAPDSGYYMTLTVTPQKPGTFVAYVKTIAIPHSTEQSHFPYDGMVDPEGEYVSVYEVTVKP